MDYKLIYYFLVYGRIELLSRLFLLRSANSRDVIYIIVIYRTYSQFCLGRHFLVKNIRIREPFHEGFSFWRGQTERELYQKG